ncbi:TIGR04219 family outer membrane beta-barrel protein [Zobellella aerophila]|uniref:TIGR04219 family outer membrane beta-barrel protein n=1 Tax=Zobellella aerophila TaxID=870480 RepID=A0ABP6W4F9_9GAMM
MNKTPVSGALFTLFGTLLLGSAQADTLGIQAGAGVWDNEFDGDFSNRGGNISASQFNFGDETEGFVYLAFEHPVPVLPNLKLQYGRNDSSGTGNVNVDFAGQTFTGNVDATIDLKQLDVIMYYELLDNWVNLDAGINVKVIDGNITLNQEDTNTRGSADFSAAMPMLYGAARFDLPFSGASVGAEGSFLAFDGHRIADYKVNAGYQFIDTPAFGLGVEVGYRQLELRLDDLSDVNADVSFSGPMANLTMHF